MRLVAKNNTSGFAQTLALPVLTPSSLLIIDRRCRSRFGQLGEFLPTAAALRLWVSKLAAGPLLPCELSNECLMLRGLCCKTWQHLPARLVRMFLSSFRAADEKLQQGICTSAPTPEAPTPDKPPPMAVDDK